MCKFAQFVLCVCIASAAPAFAQIDGRENENVGAIILPPIVDAMEGKGFKIRAATEKDDSFDIQKEIEFGGATFRIYQAAKSHRQRYMLMGVETALDGESDGVITVFEDGLTASVVRNGIFLINVPADDDVELHFRAAGKKSKVVRESLKGGRHTMFVPEGVLILKHNSASKHGKLKPVPEGTGPSLEGPVAGEEPKPRR